MEPGPLLAVLVLLVLLGTESANSPCSAGSFLNKHDGRCTPCPAGSYTESSNTRHSCNRCQQCQGGKFVTLQACMARSNTKCQCDKGYMCTSKDCKSCAAHKLCKKGQEVQQKGDSFRNPICRDCRNGTYSDTQGGVCKPWTDCSAKGLQVARSGSTIEDMMCGAPLTTTMVPTKPTKRTSKQPDNPGIKDTKKRNEGIAGIIAIILLPCVFVPFSLYIAVRSKKKQKHLPLDVMNHEEDLPVALVTAADDRCSCHCPEEEMGDWQLRQETTHKPPE